MRLIRTTRRRSQSGNVILEFGLAFPLLITFMSGMFQFGYAFFVYNQLQSAIRAGARYAALADFDGGSAGGTFTNNVRNVVVYGTPAGGSIPVLTGLTTANVNVAWAADAMGIPQTVTVNITNFTFSVVWTSYQLTNKPRATFIYLGQYLT